MAWTSMHFAVGMGFAGAGTAAVCLVRQRGWRWIPATMTLGGLWGTLPDLPRLFREDFPGLGLANLIGTKQLESNLHAWGDLFFFHRQLDLQPKEFALAGLILIILLYNAGLGLLMWLEHQQKRKTLTIGSSHLAALQAMSKSQSRGDNHAHDTIVDFDNPINFDDPENFDNPEKSHAHATQHTSDDPVVYRFTHKQSPDSDRDVS